MHSIFEIWYIAAVMVIGIVISFYCSILYSARNLRKNINDAINLIEIFQKDEKNNVKYVLRAKRKLIETRFLIKQMRY